MHYADSHTGEARPEAGGAPTGRPVGSGATPNLTEREKELLRLVCDGLTNAEIAACLLISRETVKSGYKVEKRRPVSFISACIHAALAVFFNAYD